MVYGGQSSVAAQTNQRFERRVALTSISATFVRRMGKEATRNRRPSPRSTVWGEPPMRYMTIVKGSENLAASGPPPAELVEAIGRLIEEEAKKGTMVSFGGLKPTSAGVRMRIKNGEIITTDGPFTESKEVIGGFSILNVASKQEAVEEARKFTELHRV